MIYICICIPFYYNICMLSLLSWECKGNVKFRAGAFINIHITKGRITSPIRYKILYRCHGLQYYKRHGSQKIQTVG